MKIFESTNALIRHNIDDALLEVIWADLVSKEVFRWTTEFIAGFMVRNHVHFLLIKGQSSQTFTCEYVDIEELKVRFGSIGLQKMALVSPAVLPLHSANRYAKDEPLVGQFASRQDALNWILKKTTIANV